MMRVSITIVFFAVLAVLPSAAWARDAEPATPLVEAALRFLSSQALAPPSDAALLRAGALRICGANLERKGCKPAGVAVPTAGVDDPEAANAWRRVIASALAAMRAEQGRKFDSLAAERFILDAMVEALHDPASFYVAPSVYRKLVAIPADFVGFGFAVVPQADALEVSVVHPGSPAAAAALTAGACIVRVNGQPVTGYQRPLALAAIWGADGDTLELTLAGAGGETRVVTLHYRPWTFTPFTVECRDKAIVLSVRHFTAGIASALAQALDASMKGLVLDLRDAASGDETEMVRLADLLLGSGAIGSAQARTDIGTRSWSAAAGPAGERLDVPVAVLVNGATSGAAEVLAAALKAHGRAVIIGRVTAGHATRESLRPFDDGSAIQVTSTRLFGPDGAALESGVPPHVTADRQDLVAIGIRTVTAAGSAALADLQRAADNALKTP